MFSADEARKFTVEARAGIEAAKELDIEGSFIKEAKQRAEDELWAAAHYSDEMKNIAEKIRKESCEGGFVLNYDWGKESSTQSGTTLPPRAKRILMENVQAALVRLGYDVKFDREFARADPIGNGDALEYHYVHCLRICWG